VVGFICCVQIFPFEALCCAVVRTVLRVVFSVPYACMLLHSMCMLVLSVCEVCLPHYCVLQTLSGPALLEKFSVGFWCGGGGGGVGYCSSAGRVSVGGWEFWLLLLGCSKASKILFGVMLNSSFKRLLIENSL